MYGLTSTELRVLKKLNTPQQVQDLLNAPPMNKAETCMSPRMVLRKRKAHCMEGAMLAALALRLQGRKPLVIDLKAVDRDLDHIVTIFQEGKYFGGISKTNHPVLRYREPVYNSIRELVMSFFHEYFLDDGKKTLRSYTNPINLSKFDKKNWIKSTEDLWYIDEYLNKAPHIPVLNTATISLLARPFSGKAFTATTKCVSSSFSTPASLDPVFALTMILTILLKSPGWPRG